MALLYWLESIRTPGLDAFFSLVTRFGEEALFMAVALVVFWCVDKYEGYYLLSVGFFGTVLNQFLKIACRIPRPWVLDPDFTIVESAREAATGYSFPSGHTQSALGTYGGLARAHSHRGLRILCILLCVLIPISRMYLGVHTPWDVGVSTLLALALVFGMYPVIRAARRNEAVMWRFLALMLVLTGLGLAFVLRYPFPESTDAANLLSARENFAKLFGSLLGMGVVYFLDERYFSFDTKAPLLGQALKLLLGLGLVLGLQGGLKPVMLSLFGETPLRHSVRYFLMVVAAGVVWPCTFPFFARIGRRR